MIRVGCRLALQLALPGLAQGMKFQNIFVGVRNLDCLNCLVVGTGGCRRIVVWVGCRPALPGMVPVGQSQKGWGGS